MQASYQKIPGIVTTDFLPVPPIKFDNMGNTEDHPIHLHVYQFYIIGQGFGNFNPQSDTTKFNLVDPPQRNTINVPFGGWAAIRSLVDALSHRFSSHLGLGYEFLNWLRMVLENYSLLSSLRWTCLDAMHL
ncbi:hypothetical protein LguiA_020804 [Lonicera macranthoides]